MLDDCINLVLHDMAMLDETQLRKLRNSLYIRFKDVEIKPKELSLTTYDTENQRMLKTFCACKKVDGLSLATIQVYIKVITMFTAYTGKSFREVTKNDIRLYLAYLQEERNCTNVTCNNYIHYLSSFFTWLYADNYITVNPMYGIKTIKTEKIIKQPFSSTEIEKMMCACKTIENKAIIQFMLSTGCRVSEIANLNIDKLDMVKSEAIVKGKGNKERTVYISETAMFYLQQYLATRDDTNPALFITRLGKKYTKAGLEKMIKTVGESAGISNAHPHRFRHTCASTLIKRGMPIEQVQIILGHSNISTTLVYTTIKQSAVKANHCALVG